jgi:hypothetical protein
MFTIKKMKKYIGSIVCFTCKNPLYSKKILNTNFIVTNIFVYNDKHKIATLTSNDNTLFIPLSFLRYVENNNLVYKFELNSDNHSYELSFKNKSYIVGYSLSEYLCETWVFKKSDGSLIFSSYNGHNIFHCEPIKIEYYD